MRGHAARAAAIGVASGASWAVACNLIAGNDEPQLVVADTGAGDGPSAPDAPGASDAGASGAVLLAQGQNSPVAIALDDAGVYWSTAVIPPLQILRIGKDGTCGAGASQCPEPLLSQEVAALDLSLPRALASDGDHLFWANYQAADGGATVFEMDRVSRTVVALGATSSPDAMRISGGWLYWANAYDPSAVSRAPIGQPGAVVPVAAAAGLGQHATAMAMDDTHVYWNSEATHSLYALPLGATCAEGVDCQVLLALDSGVPWGTAIDDSRAYTASCNGQGGDPTKILCDIVAVSKAGGSPVTIATGQQTVISIVSDGARVFWASYGDAAIRAAAVDATSACDATSCLVVANDQHGALLAVDSTALYWTATSDGTVWKLPK
jgi:hypothetical protein